MDIVEKYKEYRKIQVGLHNKILEKCVSKGFQRIYQTFGDL